MVVSGEEILIGSDHAGFLLKEYIINALSEEGYGFRDFGTFSEASVDYPDFIHPLAKEVNSRKDSKGIIICGSGNGVAMVANKYPFVRAAVCWNREIAALARKHNDANVVALSARFTDPDEAAEMVRIFLTTSFEGGRHEQRVKKIPPV